MRTQKAGVAVSPPMPVLKDLPSSDAVLLASIQILGHFPRDLNGRARETATAARKDERSLYQRLQRRGDDNGPTMLLTAVKDLGGFQAGSRASEPAQLVAGFVSPSGIVSYAALGRAALDHLYEFARK